MVRPKPPAKTYPTCTILANPRIGWGQFLFNQLFNDPGSDNDLAPGSGDRAKRVTDREFAESNGRWLI